MSGAVSKARLPAVLWPLMFGNVVIGMGVMVVAGLLNDIRSSLAISISTAGLLISAAALLVPPAQRGRGITFVFLGWSVASVLGTPLGAWIGGTFGWRWTMALMAVLSLVAAGWLQLRMPRGVVPAPLSAKAWRQTLLSSTLMLTLCITVLSAAGQFVLFSYMAPYVAERFGVGAAGLSTLLLVYGLCGFVGNAVVSRWIDRIGPARAMAWALGSIALGMGLVSLSSGFSIMLLAIVPWGLGVFASNSSQQARLVALAPMLAPASIALNTSAMYAGQAIGAGSGGALIHRLGLGALPVAGCAILVCALGLSLWAAERAKRHPVRNPA